MIESRRPALVFAFGAAPDVSKPAVLAGPNPARACDLSQGLAMRSTAAFMLGFIAASTPILIYVAWVAWRVAEVI
jgi:hypothetical protein